MNHSRIFTAEFEQINADLVICEILQQYHVYSEYTCSKNLGKYQE